MADTIGVKIDGDLKLGLRLDQFPHALRAQLRTRIKELIEALAAAVRAKIPHKSGSLQSKVSVIVYNNEKSVRGRMFFSGDWAKAAALEYGGAGRAFEVKGHTMRLDHVFGNSLTAPLNVFVEAHSRSTQIAARRFIRNTTSAMSDEVAADLQAVVDQTAKNDA